MFFNVHGSVLPVKFKIISSLAVKVSESNAHQELHKVVPQSLYKAPLYDFDGSIFGFTVKVS